MQEEQGRYGHGADMDREKDVRYGHRGGKILKNHVSYGNVEDMNLFGRMYFYFMRTFLPSLMMILLLRVCAGRPSRV